MRPTPLFLALWACQPRAIQTTTDKTHDNGGGDADTDADSDTDTDTDTDSDTDTYLPTCPTAPETTGPWDQHPITVAGADWTYDPYPFSGGVADLRTAALGATGTPPGTGGFPVSLAVTQAVVTSRGYVPAVPTDNTVQFWFEDGDAAMMAFYVDIGQDPNGLNPGDEIAFTATGVENYFDTPELVAVTDFQIVSHGNKVHIVDAMTGGDALDFGTQGLQTVEVWGQLASGPTDCSASCWQLQYGTNSVVFRSKSSYDYLGDCIHYIGPLSLFQGAEQLDASDFDWYFRF